MGKQRKWDEYHHDEMLETEAEDVIYCGWRHSEKQPITEHSLYLMLNAL
jgi:hypothetical protein